MIVIEKKEDCCGCGACAQRCPKHCISMVEDNEGFLYPKVDTSLCIDCGLCERVCPIINKKDARIPLEVYAAKNPNDEIRLLSSSGGIFTPIAEKVISEGGVVFGVTFNEFWEVVHSWTEERDGISSFRGSKYVQSTIGDCFLEVESFLKKGRKVLFSGTPCQVSALLLFLRKPYPNLITLDFICHGTPSKGVFRHYLLSLFSKKGKKRKSSKFLSPAITSKDFIAELTASEITIRSISFRDKTTGWYNSSFRVEYLSKKNEIKSFSDKKSRNIFFKGFIGDLYIRPCCSNCPSKSLKSGSDITIGDFWGIETLYPEADNKGYSALTINTVKGAELVKQLTLNKSKISFEILTTSNIVISQSIKHNSNRALFFKDDKESMDSKVKRYCRQPLKKQIKSIISNFIYSVFPRSFIIAVKKKIL